MGDKETPDGTATGREVDRDASIGEPRIERGRLYEGGRFPTVVVATDGTVLVTWGSDRVRVRRSTDGGGAWGPEIDIAEGRHGGGALADETTGDVLVFLGHDPGDCEDPVYRSEDNGRTWTPVDATFHGDENDNVPALHMAEHGITLRGAPHAGRLLRPARVYGDRGYNTALYRRRRRDVAAESAVSRPGDGEGAVAELADGNVYYSSRKHHFESRPYRENRLYAYSEDGGETWGEPTYEETLPDGPRHRTPRAVAPATTATSG